MAGPESGAVLRECPSCHGQYSGEAFCPNDGTRLSRTSELPTPTDPMIGTVFAERYRILRRIGEGGMGVVYEAEHVVIEKRVAIKLLRESYAGRADVIERFKQEARSASKIGHENIVDITDFGQTDGGGVFFVMEFLEGEDLADVLRKNRVVPLERAIPIIVQCCKGLAAAHAKGIIHRDMKPENIFLADRDGERDFVKILDFGIAKMNEVEGERPEARRLTKTGMIFGTPEYMSPEQAAGRPLDHRVDVYSVGIIMYEMFVGRVPFSGDTFMGILTKHMFEAPKPMRHMNPTLTIPSSLEGVIMKTLSKEPQLRPKTMTALMEEIHHAMANPNAVPAMPAARLHERMDDGVGVLPAHTLEDESEGIPLRRRKGRAPVLAALLAMLALAGGLGTWIVVRARAPAIAAPDETVEPGARDAPAAEGPAPAAPVAGATATGPGNAPAAPTTPDSAASPATAQGATAPAPIGVLVETTPGGAELLVGDEVRCASTPCTLEGIAGEQMAVVVRKAGRRTQTRVIRFDAPHTESVALPGVTTGAREPRLPEKAPPRQGGGGPNRNDLKIPAQWR